MITIYDIAKECGCSSATVSKVFNRTGNISEKKRREVLEAAERLGYVPNVAARSLVRQRSNMVGVLLFIDESLGLRHGLFAEILNRFRAEMEKHNFEIVLISEKGEMWGGRFLDHCRALRLDGVFCLCCKYDTEAVRELIGGNIPLVAFESPYEEKPSIESKNFEGAKRLTEHLIENGHRDIVFIAGTDIPITHDRIAGYRAALDEHGIPFDEDRLLHTSFFSYDRGSRATELLLACPKPFTAVMYPDDFTAISAYRDLAAAGYRVGENISVTGFDGVNFGEMVMPRLTTIRQDAVRIGENAAQMLLELIDGKPVPGGKTRLDAGLVLGESVHKLA